ncbi:SET domain-containing protein 9-like [Oscarella lobularis]|uniref:SET domain-containing protein 9-like n=1 Tax=Oscarella lobularis TaxID=121494 RepID=UPI003313F590
MSLLLNLLFGRLARRLTGSQQFQEQLDVWRLYHLTHYYNECGGEDVRVRKPDQKVRFSKQHLQVHTAINAQVIRLLEDKRDSTISFSLDVCPSAIDHPKAGHGVFLRGRAVPGSVVAFFPGVVYLPPHAKSLPTGADPEYNLYMMSRHDGAIVNANEYKDANPYAFGHLINHPPKGTLPNVMPFSYDVPVTFPSHLVPLIPNRYFKRPGFLYKTRSHMRCLVMVTTRHVQDEELLVNYRLNPKGQLPEWYFPVDGEEDKRRWTT